MFKEFLNFIVNPKKLDKKLDKKFFFFILYFIFSYYIVSFAFSYLIHFFEIDINFNTHVKKAINGNILLLAIIIAPVSEELLFRAILKPNRITFLLFCVSIFFFAFQFFKAPFCFTFIFLILISFIIYKIRVNINSFVQKNFKSIIFISSFSFAMLHSFNFELTHSLLIALPLLIIPKIYLGFALSFFRIKYGLFSSILMHSIINGILIYLSSF